MVVNVNYLLFSKEVKIESMAGLQDGCQREEISLL